jgi:hypothetical protein
MIRLRIRRIKIRKPQSPICDEKVPEMSKMFDLNAYLEKKLDSISGAGTFLGRLVGMFGRHASKAIVGIGLLLIFGIAVFVWSFVQGMGKKK